MQFCLTADELGELLADDLDEAQRLHRESHVGECPTCQQALLLLSGNTALSARWQRVQKARADSPEPPTEFLHRLKSATAQPPSPRSEAAPSWPSVPGYEVLGELGHGGMAVVYKARQLGLNRLVALKMILTGRHTSPEIQTRFRAEAEAVARLQHPSIVQVYETGEHEGQPYFSMELMAGGTLAQWISKGFQDEEGKERQRLAAEVVETLARAMHHAHRQGVIHRDLKPANILLGMQQPVLHSPKIADFGLALIEENGTGHTRSGEVLGTPSYMAPEQAQGRRRDIGPATDIHALGAILYELLTGRAPFVAASGVETLLQVSFEEPLPPRRLQPLIPPDLETICLKCLRKLPQQRYATALDLAEDLRRFRAGEPVHARPITGLERAVKWTRRRPAIAALLAGIVVVTALGFFGVTYALWQTRLAQQNEARQRQDAELALDRSERAVYFGNVAQARSQWLLNNVGGAARLLEQCLEKRRGWEWHYLHSLNHGDLLTIRDTDSPFITGLAYSPDGRSLILAGGSPFGAEQRGIVQVVDSATGQRRWRRDDLRYFVRSVACSSDGKFVATGGGNWFPPLPGEMKVWNARTGELLHDLQGHAKEIDGIAFSPDCRRLASASGDTSVRVWDLASGRVVYQITHPDMARSVQFSPDGRLLVTAGYDKGVRIWEADTGKPLAALPQAGSRIAVSPDGQYLASDQQGGAKVWDLSSLSVNLPLVHSFSGHGGAVLGLAFSPDGSLLATASADSTARTWDLATGREHAIYRGHEGRVASLTFHPEGRALATGGAQPGDVRIWDLTRPIEYAEPVSFGRERLDIDGLCFTAGDRELLALGKGGELRCWDCETGHVVKELALECTDRWLAPANLAAFSGDGRFLAAVGFGDVPQVLLAEGKTGRQHHLLRGHKMRVWHVACDRDFRQVVSTGFGVLDGRPVRELKVWDTETGRVVREESSEGERTFGMAVSPDGTHLLEARSSVEVSGGSLKIGRTDVYLSATAGAGEVIRLAAPGDAVRALAFSSDGLHLATGTERGAVELWDLAGRRLHDRPLQGPTSLSALAFSPDGTRLAGASRERVHLWDVTSGQDVLFLLGAGPRSTDNGFNPILAWSHDGSRLAVSTWVRGVSVWDARPREGIASTDARMRRAANRALAWHSARSEIANQAQLTFSDRFHHQRLEALDLPTTFLHRERGDYLARRGLWDWALADFARGVAEQSRGLHEQALLLLQTGDLEGYERLRREALERSSEGQDEALTDSLARWGGLLPLDGAAAERLLTAAKRAREAHPQDPALAGSLGLAHYRAGQSQEALRWLRESRESKNPPTTAVIAWTTLALVHLRQGERVEANRWLSKVDGWIKEQSRALPPQSVIAPADWDWKGWLKVQMLRREASTLLDAVGP